MNKSKPAPSSAPPKQTAKVASEPNPGKTVNKKVAPAAAKGSVDTAQKSTGKHSTDVKHVAEVKSGASEKIKSHPAPDASDVSKVKHQPSQSAKSPRASKASDESADHIEKSAVSKVSEVATKTSKSTASVPHDAPLLSEAQILKMSDKEYMNAAQLAFFKARLQQLEKDLLKNAGETTEHLRETVLVPDPADRATIEEEHALELRTRDRERKLLKKVQQSIASIDSGEYGWCEETGEPIGIPRLLARPTATLSLEAQQRRELKQKLYGD
jgi:DnaK suppressor protein